MRFADLTLSSLRLSAMARRASRIAPAIAFLLILASCKKLIDIPLPSDQVSTATAFATDESAVSAIAGLYSQVMNGRLLNGDMTLYPGLSSDELDCTNQTSSAETFAANALLADNSTVSGFWSNAYSYIYQCNAILEGLAGSSSLTDTVKTEIGGEAHFMRALCYFYLVNLFGDIPLETTTNYTTNASMARAASSDVYNQIVDDLLTAENALKNDYVTNGRVRPNKWTAAALLARVYLYQKNWEQAEKEASEVIGSGLYELNSNLNQIFLKDSKEAIWQLLPVSPGFNTEEGYLFVPMSSGIKPSYVLSTQLLASFEKGDKRREDWVDSATIDGEVYYYPYKYKVAYNAAVTEYYVVFRLAEQYLIRAEARAELNDISGGESDLNLIRRRAGLPDVTGLDKNSLLSAIAHERRVELFCEWGNRWFDLKRTDQIANVLGQEKNGWKNSDALYPIPLAEIKSNPHLTQNPGY